jgi:hypothetical protein
LSLSVGTGLALAEGIQQLDNVREMATNKIVFSNAILI